MQTLFISIDHGAVGGLEGVKMSRPSAQRAASGRIPSERLAVGKRICLYRIKRGWTQAQLAKALDVTTMAVSQWERGLIAIRQGRLPKIAEALKVPVGDITGENAQRRARRRDFWERMIKHFRGCPNCHAHVEFMAHAVAETQRHADDPQLGERMAADIRSIHSKYDGS